MSSSPDRADMPYRPCAGIALFNRDGKVLVGRRIDHPPEDPLAWQMPQGGIDKGEEPVEAAVRELFEETNVSSISLLTAAPDWVQYDLPDEALGRALKGRYRGQRQQWFAALFEGDDKEIDIANPGGGGHRAEFDAWRWEDLDALPNLVVPFKQEAYRRIVGFFQDIPNRIRRLDATGPWETDIDLPQ
ncbi:MAG: RNA pyrophosphohydrolase [Alphaproteobacteria bacterium]|nr:RNA pyrophosphohydrolase [Alphaproteobacteria bacterium]